MHNVYKKFLDNNLFSLVHNKIWNALNLVAQIKNDPGDTGSSFSMIIIVILVMIGSL